MHYNSFDEKSMNISFNHIPIFVISDNIISSLGFTTGDNISRISNGQTGIRYVEPGRFSNRVLLFALVNDAELNEKTESESIPSQFSRLERMMLLSISDTIFRSGIDTADSRVVFVISTTKGNIDGLSVDQPTHLQPMLWVLGERIRSYFGNPNQAIVVSNACVSGVMAVEVAARMLRSGQYDHALVVGGDLVTRFVVSGFESFQALSGQIGRASCRERV